MSLGKVGSWAHPCSPWLDLHPDVARRLLPGGREATRPVLAARSRDLRDWKAPASFASLLERVRREQGASSGGKLAGVANGEHVVLTGQQPALGGGPLFVWLKAWSAIRHAERATQMLGKPVHALFWIAGDDSDLLEVRGLADPLLRANFDSHGPSVGIQRQPVGALPISAAHRSSLVEEIGSAWPGSALTKIVERSTDLSGMLAACLRHWFGDRLIVVDAAWPEVRAGAANVYREFARNPQGIHADLAAGMERARAAGLPVSVSSWPDRLRLFHWSESGRARIVREGDGWSDGVARWTDEELQEELRTSTSEFSHDVVSRPFAAEATFPVLAHVLGPGEFSYFACLGPVSSRLGRILAPALPRASGTILPQRPWSIAAEALWDPLAGPPPPFASLSDRFLEARSPQSRSWPQAWADARANYLGILSGGQELSALSAFSNGLARFETGLRKSLLRRSAPEHSADLSSLRTLASIAGQGGLQERIWSPWALEHHLSDRNLLHDLQSVTDPVETLHVLWEHRR